MLHLNLMPGPQGLCSISAQLNLNPHKVLHLNLMPGPQEVAGVLHHQQLELGIGHVAKLEVRIAKRHLSLQVDVALSPQHPAAL